MFIALSEKNCSLLDISQRKKLNIFLSWTADSQNFVDAAYMMWVTKVRHVASRYAPNRNGRMIGSKPGVVPQPTILPAMTIEGMPTIFIVKRRHAGRLSR